MSEETATSQNKSSAKDAMSGAVTQNLKGAKVTFNAEIDLYPEVPLPHFSNQYAKAFRAISRRDGAECIAYICDKAYTPRSRSAGLYVSLLNQSLVRLISTGVAFWPPENQQKYVFVYHDSLGQPIVEPGGNPCVGMPAEKVLESIIHPLVDALSDMHHTDLVHGAVRPDNMFNGGHQDFGYVVLGDCLSTPAFSTQSPLYEPLERVLANPMGRGIGAKSDDLFALAMSAMMLMHETNPFEGKTDKEIAKVRLEQGTYACMISGLRVTGSIIEFLRGALNDNPRERWSMEEAQAWRDGRRLSPGQGNKTKRATRPIQFNGKDYLYAGALALDLQDNQAEAVQLVENGDLEQWFMRSLESKRALETLEQAVTGAGEGGRGAGYADRLICRTMIALNPEAPLKYKHVALTPDGVGTALAEAFVQNKNLKDFIDVLTHETFDFWAASGGYTAFDVNSTLNRLLMCRTYIRQEVIGYGLERCLYYLNNNVPCLSPILANHYVRTPEDLLSAFEEICSKEAPRYMIDRHSAAFLSVKEQNLIDDQLMRLNSKEPVQQIIGTLKIFANIQRIARSTKLPNLARVLAEKLGPVYERYHDRMLRQKMTKDIATAQQRGDLIAMVQILDNPAISDADDRGYRAAMVEYRRLIKERAALEKGLKNQSSFGRTKGQETAAMVASILSVIMIAGFLAIAFGGEGAGFLPG